MVEARQISLGLMISKDVLPNTAFYRIHKEGDSRIKYASSYLVRVLKVYRFLEVSQKNLVLQFIRLSVLCIRELLSSAPQEIFCPCPECESQQRKDTQKPTCNGMKTPRTVQPLNYLSTEYSEKLLNLEDK